jgi:hypothetical protein
MSKEKIEILERALKREKGARTTILNKNAFSIVGNGCKKICDSFNHI